MSASLGKALPAGGAALAPGYHRVGFQPATPPTGFVMDPICNGILREETITGVALSVLDMPRAERRGRIPKKGQEPTGWHATPLTMLLVLGDLLTG